MLIVCGVFVASFPDSAQFSMACSMKKWERVSSENAGEGLGTRLVSVLHRARN